AEKYLARSERCRDCRLSSRCDGLHINMVRAQGLALLRPLVDGVWAEDAEAQLMARWPEPPRRVGVGRPTAPTAESLPGFPPPPEPPRDPLAIIAEKMQARQEARRAARQAMLAAAKAEATDG
ncbi:MAG: hypothetical protein ACI8S6_005069, partial [Myxococcota bacterium]